MASVIQVGQTTRFKVGRTILLIVAAWMLLSHVVLMVVLNERVLFLGYAAFNLYALLVIAIPFRRLERWAWYATWILPLGLAVPAVLADDPNLRLYYVVAAACVIGLLLTRRDFFLGDSP